MSLKSMSYDKEYASIPMTEDTSYWMYDTTKQVVFTKNKSIRSFSHTHTHASKIPIVY